MSEIKNNNNLATSLREFLIDLPHAVKQLVAFGTDAIGFALCAIGVAWLPVGNDLATAQIAWISATTIVVALLLGWSQGMYRSVVRYMGLDLFIAGAKTAAGSAVVGGTVRPGITDLASIVFSDEGDILKNNEDPDLAYNQLIRPWKSRLALVNIEHASVFLDLKIILLTAVAIFSRKRALAGVQRILRDLDVDEKIRTVALRDKPLESSAPPGASAIVHSR